MAIGVSGYVAAPGGIAIINVSGIATSGVTLSRAFGSGAYTLIETATNTGPNNIFVDSGIGLPGPLPNDQGDYAYMVSDGLTSGVVSGLVPYTSLQVEGDFLTTHMLRGLQAGINNLTLPAGYQRPTVAHEMQKAGFPSLPFIFMMQASLQQSDTQIGQDVPSVQAFPANVQNQSLSAYAKRTWRISTYCKTAGEREYYRDAVYGIFRSLAASVLLAIGSDFKHDFMIQSGQEAGEDFNPGFYWSDMMFSVEGTYNVNLTPRYGIISTITATLASSGTTTTETIT